MGFKVPGVSRPLGRKYKQILKQHFSYYNDLNPEEKKHFERKVQYFIDTKEFIPRKIKRVTAEMKVLISASAVQLTFGYPRVVLSHFKRILVYPDDYYSTINQAYHKGEVNPRLQAIVLGWKNFLQGYMIPDDGINLGLHEMAHALRLENLIQNNEIGFFEPYVVDEWHGLAEQEIERIAQGKSRMFRDYAATDQDEFFAIAVENFFERPKDFKELMPNLYYVLTKLLRQDPYKMIHKEV
ncbi:MAG: zinc-dependent peptidase [Cyclobacteriaceae bacterium]